MAKLFIAADAAKDLVNNMSAIGSSDDAVIELLLGVKESEGKVMNSATCVNKTQQVASIFITEKPDDFEEGKPYMALLVKAKEFNNIVNSLVSFDSKIYIESTEAGTFIGIDGTAKLPIGRLGADKAPVKIPMKKDELLLQVKATVPEFTDAVKIGGSMVDPSMDKAAGLGDTVISVSFNEGEGAGIPGILKVYSVNQSAMSRGVCKCIVNNDAAVMARFKEKCPNGDFKVAIPKKSMVDMMRLLNGSKDVMVAVSATNVFVAIGKHTSYSFAVGNKLSSIFGKIDSWDEVDKPISVVVDAETFKQRLDLLNKVNDLNGKKNPLKLSATPQGELIITNGLEGGQVTLKAVAQKFTEPFSICLNGKMLSEVVGNLKKGNLRLNPVLLKPEAGVSLNPICISNGDVDAKATNSGIAFLLPVKDTVSVEKKEEDGTEAGTDSSDDVSEE